MEMAFAPDDGLNQGRLHPVASRRGPNRDNLGPFKTALPPPVRREAACEEQDQNRAQPAPFHAAFLAHSGHRVERYKRRLPVFLLPLWLAAIQWRRGGVSLPPKLEALMKNIVYFDLETQKSADEVGGWDHI